MYLLSELLNKFLQVQPFLISLDLASDLDFWLELHQHYNTQQHNVIESPDDKDNKQTAQTQNKQQAQSEGKQGLDNVAFDSGWDNANVYERND